MVKRFLPAPEYPIEDYVVLHWDIPSWKALDRKVTGPDFIAAGRKW